MTNMKLSYACSVLVFFLVAGAGFASNTKREPGGDELYRSNCTRCHSEWPKLSDRRIEMALRHMRVRANLQTKDAVAIARYLQGKENNDAASK